MFISRLGQGVACAVAALSLGQLAAAQSVDTLVKSAFGHTFGLFGPLPFSAEDAVASGSTVSLIDAHYGAIPLGDVRLSVQPLGDSVFQVTGRDMPQNYSDASGASVRAARWTLAGEWNAVIGGYQKLDYRINDLRMQDASGATYVIDELVMTADENGYALRMVNLDVARGAAPAEEGGADSRFELSIGRALYEGRWTGNPAGAPYASLGRSFDLRFLDAQAQGREALIAATVAHLESLYLPASSSFTDLQVNDLRLLSGAQDLELRLKSFSLPAASQGERFKQQMVNVAIEGLDIQRREDFASMTRGSIDIDLTDADIEGFSRALASLFKDAEPGANWLVLADILLFFDSLGLEGTATGLVFALPDRLFQLSMKRAEGAIGLTSMRADGGFITLRGLAEGIDLQAMDSPEGVEPEPIVIPSIVPVLGGRLIRFDPLSQSLVPTNFKTTIEVTGLPMANLRQTMESLPRSGSIQDPSAMLRSMVGGALGMVTPFLIQPPRVSVTDTEATAEDYAMSITGEHQVMPIPPLFGFGSFSATIKGLSKVRSRAAASADAATAQGGAEGDDLADYARRIAGWAERLQALGTTTSQDQQTYKLELTQFGDIELNGEPFSAQ